MGEFDSPRNAAISFVKSFRKKERVYIYYETLNINMFIIRVRAGADWYLFFGGEPRCFPSHTFLKVKLQRSCKSCVEELRHSVAGMRLEVPWPGPFIHRGFM